MEEQVKNTVIVGRNAVLEALRKEHGIECLYTQRQPYTGSLNKVAAMARQQKITIKEVSKSKLDEMFACCFLCFHYFQAVLCSGT